MSDRDAERGLETPETDAADEYTRENESFTVPDEADPADVAQQHLPAGESSAYWPEGIPAEANEADAAEQRTPIRDDQDQDDDYR
jgi:hypothetical protein